VCDTKWDEYGVKTIDGVTRLNGPGLAAKDTPGMILGGGKWPQRLRDYCGEVVGEVGEDDIYAMYRESGTAMEYFGRLCIQSLKDCEQDELRKMREHLEKKEKEAAGEGAAGKSTKAKKPKKKKKAKKKKAKSEL
jgi:hypothetical protein